MPDDLSLAIRLLGEDTSFSATMKRGEEQIRSFSVALRLAQEDSTTRLRALRGELQGLQAQQAELSATPGRILPFDPATASEIARVTGELRNEIGVLKDLEAQWEKVQVRAAEAQVTQGVASRRAAAAAGRVERTLFPAVITPGAAVESSGVFEKALISSQRAESRHQFDAETASMARAAAEQGQILRQMTARLKAYYTERDAMQRGVFTFQEQMAPREEISLRVDETGRLRAISLEEEAIRERAKVQARAGLQEELSLAAEAAAMKKRFYDEEINAAAALEARERRRAQVQQEAFQRELLQAREARAAQQAAEPSRMWRILGARSTAPPVDPNIAEWRNMLLGSLNQVPEQVARVEQALGRAHAALRDYSSGASGAHDATNRLGFAFRELVVEAGEFARGQRGQEISTFMAAMNRLGRGGVPLFIAPFAVGFGALRIAALTREYSELAAKTDDAARAAGIGTEQYSRLLRVLQLAGLDSAKLATSMGQLSQSMHTAISEPLGAKGTAFAEILGEDFFTKLPTLMEDPTQSIELLRQKYKDLVQTVGQFQAMGIFRTALGRTEWIQLSSAITATDEEWKKWNRDVDESHLPFTKGEIEQLREYDLATRKLTEDWESLGKQVAILATHSGFISWLDSVVVKLEEMVRLHPGEVITELASAVAGAGVGFAMYGPVGAAAGLAGGLGVGAVAAQSTRALGEVAGPGQMVIPGGEGMSMVVPMEEQTAAGALIPPPPQPAMPFGETGFQQRERRGYSSAPIPPDQEAAERYPQLYGAFKGEVALDPKALISEAVKYREEIEQTHRVIQARLEAEKAEAALQAQSETAKNQVQSDFTQKELQNRRAARQEEEQMLAKYRERLRDAPPATRPMAERELGERVGVTIQTEELDTRRRAAQEALRFKMEEFRIFSDTERAQIQVARGSWAQISGIYQEWLQRAKAQFGEHSTEYQTVLREMVRAAQEANDKLISDRMRGADTEASVLQSQVRVRESQREISTIGQTIGRPQRVQALQQEISELRTVAAQEEAMYQDIANMADATAEQKIAALEKAAKAAEDAGNREIQIARKIAEEQKRMAEEGARVFVSAFDKAGTEVEGLLDAAIFRTKTRQEAMRDFFLSLDKTIIHSVETIGSQLAAQGIAKSTGTELAPGKGLGDLFGSMIGKFLGIGQKEDTQTALAAATEASKVELQKANQFLARIVEAVSQQKQEVAKAQETLSQIPGASRTAPITSTPITREQLGALGTPATPASSVGIDPKVLQAADTGTQQMLAAGQRPPGYPPGDPPGSASNVAHVNVSQVGGSAVPPPDVSRVQGQPGTPSGPGIPAPEPGLVQRLQDSVSDFWNYGLIGKQIGLDQPLFALGGPVPGFQFGGPPNSVDTIPAWLSPGEFVVRRDAVDHYGTSTLHALNSKSLPKFQDGGQVGDPFCGGGMTYQGGGEIIRFPSFAGPSTASQLEREIEAEQAKGSAADYSKIRSIQSTLAILPQLWKPGMAPGRREGGEVSVPGFQSGGLAPVRQGAFETVQAQTESRGFLTPHLVQAFPQHRLGPLLAILGVAGAGLGIAAIIESLTKDEKQAKRLLSAQDTEGGTEVTSRTTTPLTQEQLDALPKLHTGGMASDELLAKLQTGERVLNQDETKAYDQLPKFHSGGMVSLSGGGHVWPAFQSGGSVDPTTSPTYSPRISTGDTSSKTALQEVSGLASSMGILAGDVEKVSKGFVALERGTTQAQGTTQRFSSELSAVSSAMSGFQSLLSMFSSGGGGGLLGGVSGIGGAIGGIAKVVGLFGLEHGGVIPSAEHGMIVGGLPSFAQGGVLAELHRQEMVLPAHISNFIQGAAASYTGTKGQSQDFSGGDIHNTFHISGVVNAHDVGRMFMEHYGTIMRAFQRGARGGFETP